MIILITGGASGLGASITRKAAELPAVHVYFTYHHSEAKAKQMEADFPNTTGIRCDFTNKEDVTRLTEQIAILNIDILVNNAYTGGFIKTYFHKTRMTDFASGFENNLLPTIVITQAAINIFRKKKSGKIITILTAALLNTPPVGSSVYVANKAYLEQLSKVWATENIKYNITSNTVSPALMLTGLTDKMDERMIEQIVSNHPLNRLLTTSEVAESVYFLMTGSQQLNGVNLILNSGANII